MHDGVHYNHNVYPGPIGSIYDEFGEQPFRPEIRDRLRFIGPICGVEAYLGEEKRQPSDGAATKDGNRRSA